ncbi:alpha-L-fucosidase [candidate division KSB1 bacterium]|nr:alpha-L-fucosidase [candidate division KSB1 bacterium]RQW09094.1 MAG: alpha-L-fucosidase [candidate division KSB1 bacterium]
MKLLFTLILGSLLMTDHVFSQSYNPTWESLDARPIPAWFQDAKFGIFIHWGLYSVPAWGPTKDVGVYEKYAEWYWWSLTQPSRESYEQFNDIHARFYGKDAAYQDFVSGFTCDMFEPDEWARIFKEAGAKYVVLTSKHHEGFCLWPSRESWNWNSVDVGPNRDLAGDLIGAVRNAGLHMGYYYSLYEWFNPLYRSDVRLYVDQHMLPQMKDLVTRYQPDIVWTDGEWDHPSEVWRATEFLAWLYNESAVKDVVVVNDRWGTETRGVHGGIWTTEYDLVHAGDASEMEIDHYWEECRGIGTSFGYNRNEYLENYSTSEELVHILINKVARGGNLLLNIGPTADGRIPVIMQQRLRDMGDWLAVNGEAIYGTRKWDKTPKVTADTKVYFTAKDNDLYALCTEFPTESIIVSGVKKGKVTMLGYDSEMKVSTKNGSLAIEPPSINPATNPCHYAWVYKIEGALK